MSNYDIFGAIVTNISICYDSFMAKIFNLPKRQAGKFNKKEKGFRRNAKPKVKEDIMDPILYIGGLDKEKYPQLPLETEKNQEEEIENPLNQRRSLS